MGDMGGSVRGGKGGIVPGKGKVHSQKPVEGGVWGVGDNMNGQGGRELSVLTFLNKNDLNEQKKSHGGEGWCKEVQDNSGGWRMAKPTTAITARGQGGAIFPSVRFSTEKT